MVFNRIKSLLAIVIVVMITACGGGDGSITPGSDNQVSLPAVPDAFSAQVISDTQINLSWIDNSDNESAFSLERKTASGGTYSVVIALTQNTLSYNDTTLSPATSYIYRIRASNSAGNSAYSNEFSITTNSSTPISSPPSTLLDLTFGMDFDDILGADGFVRHNGAAWTGSGDDFAQSSVVDENGNIYVVGNSIHSSGSWDMVLTKLTPAGVVDSRFGNDYNLDGKADGYIVFDRDRLQRQDFGSKILLDASGKILIVGYHGPSGNSDLILWRYNTDGQLDPTFGGDYNNDNVPDGYVLHDRAAIDINATRSSEVPHSIALDNSGRIVAVGATNRIGWNDLIVWRFTTNGQIDTSFGDDYSGDNLADGFLIHIGAAGNTAKNDVGIDLIIDSNNRPVITGYSTNANSDWDMVIWRLTSNGQLDTSFGGDYNSDTVADGFVIHHNAAGGDSHDFGAGIVEDSNRKYLVSGYSYADLNQSDMALWRFTSTGQLDTSFGGDYNSDTQPDGYVLHASAAGGTSNDGANDLLLDGNKIVVAGYSNNLNLDTDMVVWRFTADGLLDTSFGENYDGNNTADGYVVHNSAASGNGLDTASSITLAGSAYVVSGSSINPQGDSDISVWQFDVNGQLNTSLFGGAYDNIAGADGFYLQNGAAWGSGNDEAKAMFVSNNGDVYITGNSQHPDGDLDIVVWRYTAAGKLDTTFGADYNNDDIADGYITHRKANGDDNALAIALDSAGRVVVAGYTTTSTSDTDAAIWRFTTNGKIDRSFGEDRNSDGLLDGSVFHDGAAGKVRGDDAAFALSIGENNAITLAGYSSNTVKTSNTDMVIWRFDNAGILDATFGTDINNDLTPDGYVVFDGTTEGFYQNQAWDIQIDNTGNILITGFASKVSTGRQDMALWRYTSAGVLDSSFGTGGYVLHDAAAGIAGNDAGTALALDTSNNNILVTGYSTNANINTDMVLWRFTSEGVLDTRFGIDNDNSAGTDGFIVITDEGDGSAQALIVKPAGNITVTGRVTNANGITNLILWQFTTDGQLDISFGADYSNDGTADGYILNRNIYGLNRNSVATDIFIDGLDRILVCGSSENSFSNTDLSLLRYIQGK